MRHCGKARGEEKERQAFACAEIIVSLACSSTNGQALTVGQSNEPRVHRFLEPHGNGIFFLDRHDVVARVLTVLTPRGPRGVASEFLGWTLKRVLMVNA